MGLFGKLFNREPATEAAAEAALSASRFLDAERLARDLIVAGTSVAHARAIRGVALVRLGRAPEGFEELKTAAEAGDRLGMFSLHQLYFMGTGAPKNELESQRWCIRAADAGDVRAAYNLGAFYAEGKCGLPRDLPKSIDWYERASAAGHPQASFNLGMMLATEPPPLRNRDRAAGALVLAAKQGYPAAPALAAVAERQLKLDVELATWLLSVAATLDPALAAALRPKPP